MDEVVVVDRVVTAPGRAQKFIDAYLAGYAPGARERGMTLRDILVSPPIWFDDQSNEVTITWSLSGARAWWQMTWQGRGDPALAQWWESIADLVVERHRSFAASPENAAPAGDAAPAKTPEPPTYPVGVGVTRLIDASEASRPRVLAKLREAARSSGALTHVVELTHPGSRNGGDILVHLRFRDQNAWNQSTFDDALSDPAITQVNGATYLGTPTPTRAARGSVYRALLLCVDPAAGAAAVTAFERELAAMPRYVDTISAWQLSRVDTAIGTNAWTHVFEQEFTSVEGLMGPYLMHPIHWAVVDRWFDPETTDVIVRDRLCHSFCELATPVLR